jgi:transcriptional regulator with XRE-family HTH domain
MSGGEKMRTFRDFLKEEFKNKKFEKEFRKDVEKARISLEIAYQREKAGLTQSELAKKLNTSQSTIARLENPNYQGYSIKALKKIAEALGLELVVTFREKDKLAYEVDEKTYQPKLETRDQQLRLMAIEEKMHEYEELCKRMEEKFAPLLKALRLYGYAGSMSMYTETRAIGSYSNKTAVA